MKLTDNPETNHQLKS